MNTSLMILTMVQQFYADCKVVCEANPTQPVDEDSTEMFNNLLRESMTVFPGCLFLKGFREMAPRNIKYKDAMVVAGQLYALVRFLTQGVPGAGAVAGSRVVRGDTSQVETLVEDVKGAPEGALPTPRRADIATDRGAVGAGAAHKSGHATGMSGGGGFLTEDELKVSFEDLK